ncbi:acyl-coenzyme A thioesterase 13, partial [Lecanoromycetidae sp. Uapishka_2]
MAESQRPEVLDNLPHVQRVWESMRHNSPIYEFLLSDVSIIAASKEGSVQAQLEIKPVHLNSKGTLHGTVSACLVDWAGGLAIASTGLEKTGASTDMHTSFVSTAKEGDVLWINAKASKVGGTLAFTNVEIGKAGMDGDKNIVSTGSHTKYVKQ